MIVNNETNTDYLRLSVKKALRSRRQSEFPRVDPRPSQGLTPPTPPRQRGRPHRACARRALSRKMLPRLLFPAPRDPDWDRGAGAICMRMHAPAYMGQDGAGGARCSRCRGFPAGRGSAGTGSPGGEERGLGWWPLKELGKSGSALRGAGGCELGRSPLRTSGRTSTPFGMWSARFGIRPRAGGSQSCPTSYVSGSPSRNTCGWVSVSARC